MKFYIISFVGSDDLGRLLPFTNKETAEKTLAFLVSKQAKQVAEAMNGEPDEFDPLPISVHPELIVKHFPVNSQGLQEAIMWAANNVTK